MTAEVYTASAKGRALFGELLAKNGITVVQEGRGDVCVVDTPLVDEFGSSFAVTCSKRAVTVLIVKKERYEQTAAQLEPLGVIVIAKPFSTLVIESVLKTLLALHQRINSLQTQLNDTRLVDRAKLLLISNLKMTEPQAHKHIERQAMNRRVSRREVALGILQTYEENQ